MNKTVIAISAAAIALGTAACVPDEESASSTSTSQESSSPEQTPEKSPAPSPEVTDESLSDEEKESLFVELVREEIPELGGSDQEVIDTGAAVCTSFDEGYGILEIAAAMTDGTGITDYDAGFIIGASVAAFCPEHMDKIENVTEG